MKRILFFTASFFSLSVHAQQTDSSELLLPVEVKAVRASATAPFAKTNIGKAEIQKQNLGQDLPFLLNQTPSVIVNSDAGNGIGYTGIRIRGTDATRINVTINGIPFNDPESSGAYFVDLPDLLSSVNSIQIQRGVGTSTNGAGAFGGTINLSTNEVNKQAYFESNNSYGSFQSWKNTIKAGTGLLGNHFTADLRLSEIKSNGYIERAKTNLQSYYFSTAYLSDKTSLRFTTFSGKEKTYQAWYGVSQDDLKNHRRVNYAGTEKPGEPYENETDNYKQTHYQLFFTQQLAKNLQFNTGLFYIKGKGYYEEYRPAQNYSDYGLTNPVVGGVAVTQTDLVRQLWLDNDFYGDVFSFQYKKAGTELTLGGAATNYLGNHFGKVIWAEQGLSEPNKTYYQHDAIKNDWNVYTKWQQALNKNLQFFADVQWRGVAHDINGFEANPTLVVNQKYNFFNPKMGLTYQANNWTAFASYSVAAKEPNRDDFEASPTEQPKPERLHDWELGVQRKEKTYNLGATLYYMKYKDQLVLTGKINDVGSYTRTNIDDSYRMGVELEGAVRPTAWFSASANLSLSRNKVKNFNEFIDDYDNGGQKENQYKESDISFSPSVIGAATLTFIPVQKLNVDLLSKYVGQQYMDNTGNAARKLNAFYTQDVRARYSFGKAWLKNVDLILQVNNVFNKEYEPSGYTYSYFSSNKLTTENYYFPMAGTNWMVGLNIRL
ncbi:TonB-dependent receptor [Flavisolibacter ginsenosidimutans]|uniref:TonB-dependent receptor n=1 Tax=Flavisolibacter ginsenosidimutans TaxID=661481 RepID=A0A5B8UH71_9BACT|nr:TonB-dependent receptor [Flavisolibacter ginsenosidimutans]QEC55838.1 TonB-dependent receptor [Flavisolibacter ginsenosidimutans]